HARYVRPDIQHHLDLRIRQLREPHGRLRPWPRRRCNPERARKPGPQASAPALPVARLPQPSPLLHLHVLPSSSIVFPCDCESWPASRRIDTPDATTIGAYSAPKAENQRLHALTIPQPWAELIITDRKRYESHNRPTHIRVPGAHGHPMA